MKFTDEELRVLEDIPPGTKHELLDFARSLKEAHEKKVRETAGKKRSKPRLLGALEGKVWTADDFDESFVLLTESEYRELKEAAGLINE